MPLSIVSTLSGKKVDPLVVEDKEPLEYPSKYFTIHSEITIFKVQHSLKLNALAGGLIAQLNASVGSVEGARAFLTDYVSQFTQKLSEDWTSFGVPLGRADAEVHAFSYVAWKEGPDKYTTSGGNPVDDEKDLLCLAVYLCTVYRIGRTSIAEYRTRLVAAGDTFIRGIKANFVGLDNCLDFCDRWVQDQNYCKIVACIDLFFKKFKNHDIARIRFGTVAARFRECTALLSLAHYQDLVGMKIEQALRWIWIPRVAEQINNLMMPGQEVLDVTSLMPYMMDLGLSKRSPYSAASNPEWHMYVHFIGALMGFKRSVDARSLMVSGESNIMGNALVVAFVCRSRLTMERMYITQEEHEAVEKKRQQNASAAAALPTKSGTQEKAKKQEETKDDDSDAEEESEFEVDITGLPETQDPDMWFFFMKGEKFRIPDAIYDWGTFRAKAIASTIRKGSVGERLVLTFLGAQE
ncbi:nucleoprotein [Kwatta virus]|uniref:Nucleoprotein n=1 Tax=Kwatta virus TaxID=1272945 RepID=A0A0D3R130_9RHAB|nr:nucleoprotein [Kwatta virus]AJR28291.1 nucleoprotein [Kwatta virus]